MFLLEICWLFPRQQCNEMAKLVYDQHIARVCRKKGKEKNGIGPFPFFQWSFLYNLLSSKCAKRKTVGCSGDYHQIKRKLPTNDEEFTNKCFGINQHKRVQLPVW